MEITLSGPGRVSGRVGYSLSEKTLYFHWCWYTSGAEKEQFSSQIETLTFWPTDVADAGPDHLVVAGKAGVNTRIELWSLAASFTPGPSCDTADKPCHPELDVRIVDRRVLSNEDVPGRRLVRMLFWDRASRGAHRRYFVHFHDSRDLYRLETAPLTPPRWTKLLSATADPLVPVVPELAQPWVSSWAVEHKTRGYVYLFGGDPVCAPILPAALVLIDGNRDGVLDANEIRMIDGPTWWAEGWGDGTGYVHPM